MRPRCPRIDPAAALAAGLTVVTPNNRLARTLIARHDAAMLRAGNRTWSAARALPWSAWLGHACGAKRSPAARRRRRCGCCRQSKPHYLWERRVATTRRSARGSSTPARRARLAGEAWELVHAWGAGGESWRAWRDTAAAPAGSDVDDFARWAERYRRELASRSVRRPRARWRMSSRAAAPAMTRVARTRRRASRASSNSRRSRSG